MADGIMFSFKGFHIWQYFSYYKEENPEKCLLFNFNNEGAQAPQDTQAIEGIQAPEDTQASEDTESPQTSEAKRERKETALVEYKDPTAIRMETLAEYVILSDSETATDSEPDDSKGNEMGVDIDKAIELKTSVPYVILSDSESATDSEPEVPKGNETGAEADKEIGKRIDLDSDHEFDEIFRRSLKKRKVWFNKKKRKANKAKKVRFNEAGSSNRELAGLHADLFNHFDKALNLDDEEMSAAKRKGSGSRTGCCRPSVSGFEMDRTGGAKKQQALEAKVPRQLVMTKPLSRILEGLKSEFTNKKLPEAGKIIGSGVCGGVDECEPSGSNTMVAQAGGANCLDLVLAQAKPLDHEVLNCTLNMNPSEFCTESARNFRRII